MKSDHVAVPVQDQNTSYVEPATGSLADRWAEPDEDRSSMFRWLHLPSLRLGFSERKALLVAGDLTMLGCAWAADIAVRHWLSGENPEFKTHWGWLVSLGVMWLVSALCTGACDLRVAASPWRSQWVATGSVLMTSAMYFLTPFVTPVLPERRLVLLVIPITGTLGISLWRLMYAKVIARPQFRRRCLVIGAGWAARKLMHVLTENTRKSKVPDNYAGYWIRGFIDDDVEKEGQRIGNIPVLGTSDCLAKLVTEYRVDELILAITHLPSIQPRLCQAIVACRERGVQVTSMAAVYELVTGRVRLEHTVGHLDVVMTLSTRWPSGFFLAGKRVLDIVAGLGGCLLAVLVAPLVWLANLLTSPGPLFFSQNRVGKKGNIFQVVKFRSMVPDAEENTGGPVWAQQNDERIKGVGSFLRRTRLDELPQCWNVLRGEMSLVGPRPERPEFVQLLSGKIPFYRLRHGVKPGITGWAQVRYHYGASVEDSLVKVEYDLYYIKHQSMFIDWQILLESILVVARFQGR